MINYEFIHNSSKFYELDGYTRIEVPWWVTQEIANITCPVGVNKQNTYNLSLNNKCLVASGEQSFLYLKNKDQLINSRYQTITPCFRNDIHDQYHFKQFMKLELIEFTEDPSQNKIIEIASLAIENFKKLNSSGKYLIVETKINDPISVKNTYQLDVCLEINDKIIELGSYGARKSSFCKWIYGTGIAEPRFSKAFYEMNEN